MNINKEEHMNKILEFWFPLNSSDQDLYKLWYQKSNTFDQQIRENFALDWQLACNDYYNVLIYNNNIYIIIYHIYYLYFFPTFVHYIIYTSLLIYNYIFLSL